MADAKISALTSATTPLAGTEVLPIVQSGATVKVAVSNLTSGRAVTGLSFAATDALNCISSSYASGVQLGSTTAYVYSKILNTYANGGVFIGYDTASQTGVIAGNNELDVYTYGANWQKTFSFSGSGNATAVIGNVVVSTSGKGFTLPGGITWTSGAGSPEGVVTAPVGSLYSRSNGGALTSFYVKESGAGNTGWVGK